MKRIYSNELKNNISKEVYVAGFMHNLRVMGKIAFLILRDRKGLIQIVLENEDEIKKLNSLYTGSIISANGVVIESSKSQYGYEIQKSSIKVIQPVKYPSPIDITKNELNVEFDTLLENRVVTLRHPKQSSIFELASIAEKCIREYFYSHDFTQINSPKMIAFPTEGGAEVFEVNYFDKKAYMAQSPQFYKQIMVGVFEKVFEIGRAYRAENSNTSRHMSEILMLDMEMGFIDSFEDIINTTEDFFKSVVLNTWELASEKIKYINNIEKPLIPNVFPRIKVKELHELVKKETGEDFTKDYDISPFEEKFINDYSKKHWNSEVVFITDFPWADAKFYHHQNEIDKDSTDRADLIFRGVEVATLTRREVNYDKLINQIKSKGIDPNHPGLKQYLDSFKYGMPEEGGFGFGIARFIQKLIGLENAKEAELFPSDPKLIGGVRVSPKIFFGKELFLQIFSILNKEKIDHKHIKHEIALTSEESSKLRGNELNESIKAIILKGKKTGKNILLCFPADLKINLNKLNELENEKFEFENLEIIKNKYGLEKGSIPPFGNLLGITTYFSSELKNKEQVYFNVGTNTDSVKMSIMDLIKLIHPIII